MPKRRRKELVALPPPPRSTSPPTPPDPPRVPRPTLDPQWRAALDAGALNAACVLGERERLHAELRALPVVPAVAQRTQLVADGDSWFDYAFFDVLDALEDSFGYEVESVAHAGDTLESMAYDFGQFNRFHRALDKLRSRARPPAALLLSAGGNDVAGPTLAALLNDRSSPTPGISHSIMKGVFDERLRVALITLISTLSALCRHTFDRAIPVVIHGYDYFVPDGRGFAGGALQLPGPWLEPQFRARGYQVLHERLAAMRTLVDRFNAMAAQVAGGAGLEHVTYVDLRGTLNSDIVAGRYKQSWGDELHPTRAGFIEVAAHFDRAIQVAIGARPNEAPKGQAA